MSLFNLMVNIVSSIVFIFAAVAMSAGSRKIEECKKKLKECEERNPQEYKEDKIESNPLEESEKREVKKEKVDVWTIAVVVLSITAILAFIYAYHLQMNANKSTQQVPFPQEQNTSQVDEYGNPIIKGYGLEVENWSWSSNGYGYVNVEGKVKNISGKKLSGVMVVVDFYDKNGKYIETERGFIDDDPILPNQISPFNIFCSYDPAMYEASLSFKFFGGEKIPSKSE